MEKIIFSGIYVLEFLAPIVFVMCVIFKLMKNMAKAKEASVAEQVFSYLFVSVFFGLFIAVIPLFALGYKTIGIICFVALPVMLVGLLLSDFIYKKTRKVNVQPYNAKGKIIRATFKKSYTREETGREPIYIGYYQLTLVYRDEDGKDKTVKTIKSYKRNEIAYLCKLNGVDIDVYKKHCEIKEDLENVPEVLDEEDLTNLSIVKNVEQLGIDYFRLDLIALYVFVVPMMLHLFCFGLFAFINHNLAVGIVCSVIFVIITIVLISMTIFLKSKTSFIKKGKKTFAVKFRTVGSTNAIDTFCDVQYVYQLPNGEMKSKVERVPMVEYSIIKNLKKLPIKILKDKAIIDLDELNKN